MDSMIDSYRFGRIVVDGVEYKRDLIIFPENIKSNWWRVEGHRLLVEDIQDILSLKPDALVVGRGAHRLMEISEEVKEALAKEGISLKEGKTPEACEMYNETVKKGKRTVAALHITC